MNKKRVNFHTRTGNKLILTLKREIERTIWSVNSSSRSYEKRKELWLNGFVLTWNKSQNETATARSKTEIKIQHFTPHDETTFSNEVMRNFMLLNFLLGSSKLRRRHCCVTVILLIIIISKQLQRVQCFPNATTITRYQQSWYRRNDCWPPQNKRQRQ